MKISIAEFPDEIPRYDFALNAICHHLADQKPDLLVLPEMPFTPWVFHTDLFDQKTWNNAVETHAEWLKCFAQKTTVPLISSRPINVGNKRLNQAFYLDRDRHILPLRSKYYLPNDYPAIETPWFDVGDMPGEVFDLEGQRIGVQLCSELMYAETPRLLGQIGAGIIVQSRATGASPRWRAASVLAAATSGAFVVGANRRSIDRNWFTGGSWVYSPDGDLLAETAVDSPVISVEIDFSDAARAKTEYPLTMFANYGSGQCRSD